MKTFTRRLLALALVATPMLALVELASANTELVPASRLVAPYWDISGTRNTLFLLTNVSKSVDLKPFVTIPFAGVHVEFYDKTCVRQNMTIELSAGDVDQIDLKSLGTPTLPSNLGWADIDVREKDAQRDKDSVQCNVLLGVVVNSDSAGDFAVAYPMASSIGSSNDRSGLGPCSQLYPGDTIVEHNSDGGATQWSGRYEPFPSRVFVPFFFAEGGDLGMTSQLVLAAPADGNWFDGGNNSLCPGFPGTCVRGESPGQNLPGVPPSLPGAGNLMSGTALFWDGCENKESRSFSGHYVNLPLSNIALLGPKAVQEFPWTHDGLLCKNAAAFPSVDDDYFGAFVGWVDLPNSLADSSANGTTSSPGDSPPFPRGMVGVLIQNTTISKLEGDVVRLWGDPADGGRYGDYSLVDEVSHNDLD